MSSWCWHKTLLRFETTCNPTGHRAQQLQDSKFCQSLAQEDAGIRNKYDIVRYQCLCEMSVCSQ